MRAFLTGLAAFAITFLIAHFVVLSALPGKIMSTVRGQMVERGMPVHAWAMSPRVTPESQPVVRPSPDLAYAICLIDLSNGPVELSVPAWPEYGSLSIFEADTDNVYAGSLDARAEGTPGIRRVIVALEGQDLYQYGEAEQVIVSKPEALALIRRLAPSQAAYEAAAALIPASRCAPL
ncbi:hypothetical protein BBF93_14995 [Hyphomonas sp. CACIAM 19H1]|uniref:DUF1254 domain-containing protein n=1 Tax=Hyphomonas sp. CACIAM 19H1 TaxID=1873716 RepID=UPI000DEDD3A2|nr:DUF1254 domain-containing protein [Hyphomonas sp. CACIAM 19H1]AXE65383.1 hypothetical protein BBF93_14995 [Hyphomonas sp. CACIAM 19H1]